MKGSLSLLCFGKSQGCPPIVSCWFTRTFLEQFLWPGWWKTMIGSPYLVVQMNIALKKGVPFWADITPIGHLAGHVLVLRGCYEPGRDNIKNEWKGLHCSRYLGSVSSQLIPSFPILPAFSHWSPSETLTDGMWASRLGFRSPTYLLEIVLWVLSMQY